MIFKVISDYIDVVTMCSYHEPLVAQVAQNSAVQLLLAGRVYMFGDLKRKQVCHGEVSFCGGVHLGRLGRSTVTG